MIPIAIIIIYYCVLFFLLFSLRQTKQCKYLGMLVFLKLFFDLNFFVRRKGLAELSTDRKKNKKHDYF